MWEDGRRRRIIINVVLLLMIAAIAVGLWKTMDRVSQQTQAHDQELATLQAQQQEEQSAARIEAVEAIQAEYEKDMQTVAEYLPGIVCWGDSITLGPSGGISYPYMLQKYIDTYLCDIYNFRSTIPNFYEFNRLNWDDYTVSIPVINMGSGRESSLTVLGRSGAVPFVTGKEFTIPADTEPVAIDLKSENGKRVNPLEGGDAGVNNVRINGIEGVISIDTESYYYSSYGSTINYLFRRLEPGRETVVPEGTQVITSASDKYKDYIHVVCIGTYGDYYNPEELVKQVKTLLSRQTKNTDRFIVLGLCSINGYTQSTYQLDAIDAAMLQAFDNRYINVRTYLAGEGIEDAGIELTINDSYLSYYQAVPEGFISVASTGELNGKALSLVGKLIFNRMESLGYFDEVYDELGIRDTTKQILRSDPGYFSRMISNSVK